MSRSGLRVAKKSRILVAHYEQIYVLALHHGRHGLEIGGLEYDIGAIGFGAAVAGGNEETCAEGAAAYLIGQGAFAAA